MLAAFGAPETRAELRAQLTARRLDPDSGSPPRPAGHRPLSRQAQAEQEEHDRYFRVGRTGGDAAQGFSAGLTLAYLSAYENCLSMGVTLLDDREWRLLFGGLAVLLEVAGGSVVQGGTGMPAGAVPDPPNPAGWRDAYDPPARWLVGHQLFFALIQGAIVGLNCFTQAAAVEAIPEADEGLALAAVFMRSSAAAMKFASDFAPGDYETTVRPAMAPPKVREGFSGLQTRDHAYLVRIPSRWSSFSPRPAGRAVGGGTGTSVESSGVGLRGPRVHLRAVPRRRAAPASGWLRRRVTGPTGRESR